MLHGIELDYQLPVETYRLLNKADHIICNSRFTKQRISKMGLKGEVRQVYYPGMSPEIYENHPRKEADHPLILMVGRMASTERYKGHEQMLEAWPGVVSENSRARLIFAGHGDDVNHLKKIARKKSVDDSVEFRLQPSDEELAELYAQSWLKVLPSTREGQGLVYDEALSRGVPVLAVANTVAEEFITHKDNGILAESREADTLAGWINFAINDSEWRKKAGDRAIERSKRMAIQQQFETEILSIINGDHECAV